MPTFIDESGDVGSVAVGGKPYFRLAAVWVPTHDEAVAFRGHVRNVRRDLPVRDDYEFKFANTHQHPEHRRKFFDAAMIRNGISVRGESDRQNPQGLGSLGPS